MKIKHHLTYRADLIDATPSGSWSLASGSPLAECVGRLSDEVRNLKNNAIFFIRQLHTAKRRIGLKLALHLEQQLAIERHDEAVAEINLARQQKNGNPLPLFANAVLGDFEDRSLLNEVLRDYVAPPSQNNETGQAHSPYRALQAHTAQQTIGEVIESFKAFREATADYYANPKKYEAPPEIPGYLKEHEKPGVPFVRQSIGARLPRLKTVLGLSPAHLAAWDAYPIHAEISRALLNAPEGADWCEFRLTPKRNGIRLHVVVCHEFEVADDSAVARQEPFRNKRTGKVSPGFKFDLESVRVAGLDPGVTSPVTLAFGTGARPVVMDWRRTQGRVAALDKQIDEMKSALTPAYLKGAKLPPKEMGWHLARAWAASPALAKLVARRQRIVDNFCHQVSREVVDHLVDKKIDVLVMGRNKRMKADISGKETDKKKNRNLHVIPHACIYEQIAYKARMKGIVVIETEESYTSLASFTQADRLNYQDGEARQFSGTRNGPVYRDPAAPRRWQKIHADVNAAYNIIRKVFPGFRWHKRLSRWFKVIWYSPKGGFQVCQT